MAVIALKARRALHAIKRKFYNFQIPVKIWLKIFDSVIQPIALYSSEVWSPLNHQPQRVNDQSKPNILLGEGDSAYLAAQYISTCHTEGQ